MSESRLNLTFEQMLELFDRGAVGQIELRSWVANNSASFAEVRDVDVDNAIRERAEAQQENFRLMREADKLALDQMMQE